MEISVDALCIAVTELDQQPPQHLQIGLTTAEEADWVELPIDTMVFDEREFYGSFGMPPNEYEEIFSMMAGGSIDPGRIVSETISLEEVPATLERMSDFDTVGIPVVEEF